MNSSDKHPPFKILTDVGHPRMSTLHAAFFPSLTVRGQSEKFSVKEVSAAWHPSDPAAIGCPTRSRHVLLRFGYPGSKADHSQCAIPALQSLNSARHNKSRTTKPLTSQMPHQHLRSHCFSTLGLQLAAGRKSCEARLGNWLLQEPRNSKVHTHLEPLLVDVALASLALRAPTPASSRTSI